jgi:hypothetical protein
MVLILVCLAVAGVAFVALNAGIKYGTVPISAA